jgi:hypothetical protein
VISVSNKANFGEAKITVSGCRFFLGKAERTNSAVVVYGSTGKVRVLEIDGTVVNGNVADMVLSWNSCTTGEVLNLTQSNVSWNHCSENELFCLEMPSSTPAMHLCWVTENIGDYVINDQSNPNFGQASFSISLSYFSQTQSAGSEPQAAIICCSGNSLDVIDCGFGPMNATTLIGMVVDSRECDDWLCSLMEPHITSHYIPEQSGQQKHSNQPASQSHSPAPIFIARPI